MKTIIVASLTVVGLATSASAQKMPLKTSNQIVTEGHIISSGPVGNNGASRAHEVFANFKGNLYYCLINGAADAGRTPYAECYGPPIGRD